MGKPRFQALRVLRGQPDAAALRAAKHQRHSRLAAVHEAEFRRLIDDHVHHVRDEIEDLHFRHRPHAGDRAADRATGNAGLRNRRIAHALFAEFFLQAARCGEDAADLAHVFAQHENARIAFHFLGEGFFQRLGEQELARGRQLRLRRLVVRRVHRAFHVGEAGLRARLGEFFCGVQFRFDFGADRVELRLLELMLRLQQLLEARNRVELLPILHFVVGAVARQVGAHRVVAPAVRERLDQARSTAFARARHRFAHRGVHRQHIVAVDGHSRQRVGGGAFGKAVDGSRVAHRGRQPVLVVLAQEHHRQLPQRGDVQALVEDAFVAGAVAEEHHADRAIAAQLVRQRRAGADANARADDAVRTEHVEFEIGDMHRAAQAFAVAGHAPHQLRHHARQRGALGDAVAVAAVMADDEIVFGQVGACAGSDSFLADVTVRRTLHQSFFEQINDALVEAADA